MLQRRADLRLRQAGKLTKTGYSNEIAQRVNELGTLGTFGQVEDPNRPAQAFFPGFIRKVSGTGTPTDRFKYKLCGTRDMSDDSVIGAAVSVSEMFGHEPIDYLAADRNATDADGVLCMWCYDTDGQTPIIIDCGEIPDGADCAADDSGDGDDADDGGDM